MKTAEEILNKNCKYIDLGIMPKEAISAMEEYAEQFKTKLISVEEQLPEPSPDDNRLTKYVDCVVWGPTIGFLCRPFNPHHNCWDDEDMDDHFSDATGDKVTHWMPMPEPPNT